MKKLIVLARLVRLAVGAGQCRRARYYYRTLPTNSRLRGRIVIQNLRFQPADFSFSPRTTHATA